MRKYILPILLLAFWSCEEEAEEILPEDCLGVEGGSALVDSCGNCDDDPSNDCTEDCAGVFGGTAVVDCNNECDGSALIDDCGNCSGGNTELEYNYAQDCNGVCDGTSLENECGCVGGDTGLSEDYCYTCVDIDGNQYQTILMDGRVWMAENLRVTHYKNGDAIPTDYTDSEWGQLTTGAYTVYPTNTDTVSESTCGSDCGDVYGNLYNWYAVGDERGICPEGWGIPSGHHWGVFNKQIKDFYGDDVGGMMKECTEGNCPESEYWVSPNTEATNELGFNGLPSGIREVDGSYLKMGLHAFFWTRESYENTDTTSADDVLATASILHFNASGLSNVSQTLQRGESCRCVFKYYDSSPPYEE